MHRHEVGDRGQRCLRMDCGGPCGTCLLPQGPVGSQMGLGAAASDLIGPTRPFSIGKLACSFWKLASETNSSFLRLGSVESWVSDSNSDSLFFHL